MQAFTARQLAEIESNPRSKRQLEFSIGRECAHAALLELGEKEIVGVAHDRSPNWPKGFTGSISHSDSRAWSVAVRKSDVLSIGIDTESIVDAHSRIQLAAEIATKKEWGLTCNTNLDRETSFTVVFSAKESFCKSWAPITNEFFGFQDAMIESMDNTKLTIRMTSRNPNHELSPTALDVHYFVEGQDVFTATWITKTDRR